MCERKTKTEENSVYVLNCIICLARACVWVNVYVCRYRLCVCRGGLGLALQLVPQSLSQHHVGGNLPVLSNQGCNWLSTLSPLLLKLALRQGNRDKTKGTHVSSFHIVTNISYRKRQLHTDLEVYKDWKGHIRQSSILLHPVWFTVWFTRAPV